MITNTGFCSAARAAALDEGLDLFILRQLFAGRDLRTQNGASFEKKLEELSVAGRPLYSLDRI